MNKLKIISTIDEVHELIRYCKQTGYASIDFETSGLKYYEGYEIPTILGVSFQIGSAWIIPLAHFESPFRKDDQWLKVFRLFGKEVLEDWDIVKIAWNLKFEYKWCLAYGITLKGRLFDAQLAKYCLDEEIPNDLKSWVAKLYPKYANYEKTVKGVARVWKDIPMEDLAPYCGLDADLTFRLMNYFEGRLLKGGFYSLFRNLLMMATRDLADMEYVGMLVDRPYLIKLMADYKDRIEKSEYKLNNTPALLKFLQKRKQRVTKQLVQEIQLDIARIANTNAPNAARLIANRETKIKNILAGHLTGKEQKLLGDFNWKSPKQVAEFFYTSKFGLGLKIPAYTKNKNTGQFSDNPSTSEETLLTLAPKDKTGTIKNLLEYRGMTKLESTYVTGMYNHLSENDRIHSSYHCLTVTGRLGCVHGDTLLTTNKGLIPIKDICPTSKGAIDIEDRISVLTHKGRYCYITRGINKGIDEMYEVILENGMSIMATSEHKFRTNVGWKKLYSLFAFEQLGWKITVVNPKDRTGFSYCKITNIIPRGIQTVYDITVPLDESYVGNGMINHNSREPNLQNIPRSLTANDIKQMFVPPKGYIYLECDYGQAELRVVAELAEDKAMIDIFKKNYNIHVATACKVNGGIHLYDKVKDILKDENHKDNEFWERQKKNAKSINFGILYGQTERKLSQTLECTEEEAKQFIVDWYAAYPQVAKWIKQQVKDCRRDGYVRTPFGRKRRLYNIYSEKFGVRLEAERQSVNAPIQGTASDFALLSGIIIREKKLKGELPDSLIKVNTVHDSIGFYVKPEDIHKVVPELLKICENPTTKEYFGFELKHVKMKIAIEVGIKSWGEKSDYDPWVNYVELERKRWQ